MLKNAMEYANIEGYEYRCIDPTVKEDMDFIKKYNTFTFPTLLKLDDEGNEAGRICNNNSLAAIREFLKEE